MTPVFKLLPDAVTTAAATSKQDVLATLAELMANAYGLDETSVLEGLEEREHLGSTGFGRGVAIPHARLDGLNIPVAALVRLDSPVDFKAADGMLVGLVVGLLSPSNAGVTHLHALAAISRMVRDEAINELLAEAGDSEALFALLTNVLAGGVDRDAA